MRRLGVLLVMLFTAPAFAASALIPDSSGKNLVVEIQWQTDVDLDLFLTDPNGETIYFANRRGRSGVTMGLETGCGDINTNAPPWRETATIPAARAGRYRVSVDFIRDCENPTAKVDFGIRLFEKGGATLGRENSSVTWRALDTVSWEFDVK